MGNEMAHRLTTDYAKIIVIRHVLFKLIQKM